VLGIDATRGDEISVEEMPFNDQFATEVTRNLEIQEKRDLWWSVGKNVAYPALALGIIWLFVRMFKRTSSEEIPLGVPVGRMGAHLGNGNGHGNGHPFELGNGENGNDVVTVEVLNQLIKENPQNMTQAIRSWLNRGTPSNQ
jgi:flagellar biosynthesis/type III secretory pathway M-ring protein FliF/YscJ